MKKPKTPEERLEDLATDLIWEHAHWDAILEDGCNDPSWPDGTNANLTRNHIIYDKREIEALCTEAGLPLPEAYWLPVPPQVDENFMARFDQAQRVERLKTYHGSLTSKRPKTSDQMAMF